jgi:carboxymethylenebutenolidase
VPDGIDHFLTNVDGLTTFVSRPSGGSPAGMLLLPMITGIGEQVREFADGLAGHGLTTLSWDPWQGRGSLDDTPMEQLFEWMSGLDDETSLDEQRRLLDHLHGALGCARVGTIGWCLGGRFALLLGARETRLANVVAYHPARHGNPVNAHAARLAWPRAVEFIRTTTGAG